MNRKRIADIFSKRLDFLLANGFTKSELSKKAGVSPQRFYDIEKAVLECKDIKTSTLYIIAKALQVEVSYFFN